MLRGTATALTRSADATGVLVVGALLTLLTWVVTPVWIGGSVVFPPLVLLAPLALAPAFVARGYFVRVLAAGAADGNVDGAPPFVAWNELYRTGLKSALLSVVLLAPLALMLALAAAAVVALATGLVDLAPLTGAVRDALGDGGAVAAVGAAVGLGVVISAAYLLVFAYVRPAALAAFAASGRLRDGFRPRRVARVAGSGAYATAWVAAVATVSAGYALAAPLVPLVVGAAFVFVVRVAAYGLYGRGAAATLDVVDASDTDGPAADAHAPEGDRVDRSSGPARTPTPEVPPTVQTGRSVPVGGTGVGRADGDGPVPDRPGGVVGVDGGFDWYAPDGEPGDRERTGADGRDGPDDATGGGGATDAADEFEWAADVADPKDKR